VALGTGDQVVFFTDGVIEAVNADGDVFGTDLIDEALAETPPTADGLLRSVLRSWTEFTAGVPASDDRTLVVVARS
jgi:sigma-B regulation protein RsbU (phosphoserine phosphatase)